MIPPELNILSCRERQNFTLGVQERDQKGFSLRTLSRTSHWWWRWWCNDDDDDDDDNNNNNIFIFRYSLLTTLV